MNAFVYLKNPLLIIRFLRNHRLLDWLPDKQYLELVFLQKMGRRLDLKNPASYCEKLQWMKLYDRKPIYTIMVDKYACKKYVAKLIGEDYIIPTYGVWRKFEDIPFETLPDQFVLKCTHDSGGLVICKEKASLDKEWARSKIEKSLKTNYYLHGREWPYKDVPRRIIAEEYMVDESGTELKDYKFFCFNGVPKFVLVVSGREGFTKRYIYDMEWKRIPVALHGDKEPSPGEIAKPCNFSEMKELAKKLSEGMAHLRVDFYAINGKTFFGELTFYHMSGMEHFYPESYDYEFGDMLTLPTQEN